jgi:hypothetical protein
MVCVTGCLQNALAALEAEDTISVWLLGDELDGSNMM